MFTYKNNTIKKITREHLKSIKGGIDYCPAGFCILADAHMYHK
ncbi:bacteriocin-like protein [Chryseobacterium pennae]